MTVVVNRPDRPEMPFEYVNTSYAFVNASAATARSTSSWPAAAPSTSSGPSWSPTVTPSTRAAGFASRPA